LYNNIIYLHLNYDDLHYNIHEKKKRERKREREREREGGGDNLENYYMLCEKLIFNLVKKKSNLSCVIKLSIFHVYLMYYSIYLVYYSYMALYFLMYANK